VVGLSAFRDRFDESSTVVITHLIDATAMKKNDHFRPYGYPFLAGPDT
jgi:hypothetical protein